MGRTREREMAEYDMWRTLGVYETGGEWIGEIADIYDDDGDDDDGDDATDQAPALVTVRAQPSTRWSSFVPLRGVATRDGDRVVVPFDRATVVAAPGIDDDDEAGQELVEEAIIEIYAHYGLDPSDPGDERRKPARWRRVVAREVAVEVVPAVDDTAALAEVLPEGVTPERIQDAVEAVIAEDASEPDKVAVVIVHDQQVERLADPEETEPGTPQPL